MPKQKKKDKINITKILVFVCCLAVLGISFVFAAPLEKFINFSFDNINSKSTNLKDDYLKIHYIDVGQGDATAIELPDGKVMLIDAGPRTASTNLTNYLDQTVFGGSEIARIDYFILTHPHEDHIGGAIAIMQRYDIGTVYRPDVYSRDEQVPEGGYKYTTSIWNDTVAMIKNKNIRVKKNSKTLGKDIEFINNSDNHKNYSFTFYGPAKNKYSDLNDYSPIMILENNGKKFMFTGDATVTAEREVMNELGPSDLWRLNADVLHVGHHGSKTSTSQEFLNTVNPSFAIISSNNKDNNFNHPHDEVVNRLLDINIKIYRTDTEGSIVAGFNNNNKLVFVVNYYVPNNHYIYWYMVAITLAILAAAACFTSVKKRQN